MIVGMSRVEAGKLGYEKTKHLHDQRHKEFVEKYNASPKICEWCGDKIQFKKRYNKFCNHSCAALFNNSNNNKPHRFCIECNSSLDRFQKKYCGRHCQKAYEWRVKKAKIAMSSNNFSLRAIKKYLLEEQGHQCEICKLMEWQGKPIPTDIDHIDGNPNNNDLDNLRIICCNCHAQTPTYKGKNKGNGRHERRKRYANGQSY